MNSSIRRSKGDLYYWMLLLQEFHLLLCKHRIETQKTVLTVVNYFLAPTPPKKWIEYYWSILRNITFTFWLLFYKILHPDKRATKMWREVHGKVLLVRVEFVVQENYCKIRYDNFDLKLGSMILTERKDSLIVTRIKTKNILAIKNGDMCVLFLHLSPSLSLSLSPSLSLSLLY